MIYLCLTREEAIYWHLCISELGFQVWRQATPFLWDSDFLICEIPGWHEDLPLDKSQHTAFAAVTLPSSQLPSSGSKPPGQLTTVNSRDFRAHLLTVGPKSSRSALGSCHCHTAFSRPIRLGQS
ncbi:hypothetical protein H1C71_003544 [Ictidomys tridecemlineatus]|nr:hypothetical protein H1C71_003544 [Ictidomys tridecemlineatus]